ncbi:hypothetical protein JCM33374_g3608 [Metschnikowia sp. JCM 33374]|nr:hypothetical protein JCM33374_g3608 [Metschnikowia sp. JCM 33374]
MNIPDGEYDIDLSVLGDSHIGLGDSSLAIRYGFIPDSMDQSSPLTLFQKDDMCILEANSVERPKQTGQPPIIFEGVPQRQRPTSAGGLSLASDSFFLSFSPAEKGPRNSLKVQLRRLESTVRVNKSRNADKWRSSIKEWQNGADNSGATPGKTAPESVHVAKQKSPHVSSPLLKRKQARPPPKNGSSTISRRSSPAVSTPVSERKTAASKRPPAPNSESKNDIISVSDFEDLDSGEEDGFPVFEESAINPQVKKTKDISVKDNLPKKKQSDSDSSSVKREKRTEGRAKPTESKPVEKNVQSSIEAASHKDDDDMLDMDDDFADLEDQLDEVLDERQTNSTLVNSDSDEDSDTGAFAGTPIVIDIGEEKKSAKSIKLQNVSSRSKPMSLRELYGGEKNDYLSSSEEE